MKKIKLIASVICLSLCSIKMNAQNYRWTTGGSSNTASITPKKSTMDASGNSIIAGQYQTAVDMDFSNGALDTFFLYPKPVGGVGRCVFFAKYAQDGHFSWAKRLYNPRSNTNMDVTDVATDAAGNVYIAGSYTGWCDFNPSDAVADTAIRYSTQSGTSYFQSMYVAKYDVSGHFVWVMNFDGGVSTLNDIAIRKNTLYVTGETRTTTYPKKDTDFDPSELAADTLFFNGTAANNPFFAAYDLNGDLKTAKRLNGTISATGRGIDADTAGNIYVTGSLMGLQDFNPSGAAADTAFLTGSSGVFLAKYDSTGVYKWAKPVLENSNYTLAPLNNWVHILQDQSVYAVGYFKNKVDFDPKPDISDTSFLNAGSGISSYIARYAVNGDFKNAYALGDTAATKVANILGVSSDDSNYLYIAGQFNGKTDFNLQKNPADTLFWSSVGNNVNSDIFFAKYANDTVKWSRKVGNSGAQLLSGLGVNNKHLTIFGNFAGDVIFDPMPPVNIASQLIGDGTYLASYRTFPPSSDKKLLTYAFATPPATGTITGDTVFVTVPFGTPLTALVANFTVSSKAIALVGATLQVSGTTPNNFTGIATYTVMAEDSSTKDYFVKVKVERSSGIKELSDANNSFKVWPNPAEDVLH
ncbi:MAG TPA: hypothetical protein VL092_08620, partial [Chitinophagaceae bacterium]|nr:hypothetical protein [Chitinophagaceae bacterium]